MSDIAEIVADPEVQKSLALASPEFRLAWAWRMSWFKTQHSHQTLPHGDWWSIWLMLAGRGAGKTRTAAEQIAWWAWEEPNTRWLVAAPTSADVRATCFEGDSGLLTIIPKSLIADYNKQHHELRLINGSLIKGIPASEPERFRGPQFHGGWCDELAAWDYLQEAWDQIQFGMRLGKRTRMICTTTPKPKDLIIELIGREGDDVVMTTASTYANLANLSDNFRKQILSYEGTKLGRQEIYAEIIDPEEGGIVKRDMFKLWPAGRPFPRFEYIIQSYDVATSVAVDNSGNVAVAGYGVGATSGQDFFAARYSANGSMTYFERLIDGGNNRTDAASAVALNAAGHLAVAGYAHNASNNMDFRVLHLDAGTGATHWQYNLNGSTNTHDQAYAVAFDVLGNVVATGSVRSSNYDLYTVKLDTGGGLLWQKQWNSTFDSSDTGYDLTVDGNGDVIVGGTSYRSAGAQDGYVAKYRSVDGALVWERRFNGVALGQDLITALGIDAMNNVVATGYTQNAAGNYDVLTAKMFANDGGLIWERQYNGAADKNDSAGAVALSPDGNVFVAGYSTSASDTTDFWVKNYRALTAAVQAPQTITFANPGTQSSSTPLNLVATASSGLAVHFTVISGPAQMDPVVNTRLNFTGNGSVTVRASQSGNRVLDAAPSVNQTFTVNRVAQTLAFTLPATLSSTAQWPLTGVASSGLAVTYSILSDPGSIASISGGILSFTGIGSVTVRASQAGDGRFNAAVDVDSVVSVFNNAPILMLDNVAENWRDLFPGSGAGEGNDIALQLSGNDAVAGFVAGYTSTGTGKDLYLAKYHSNGTKLWTRISGTSGDDEARAVVVDGNGDVVVAGYITGANGQDVFVAKYNGGSGGHPSGATATMARATATTSASLWPCKDSRTWWSAVMRWARAPAMTFLPLNSI